MPEREEINKKFEEIGYSIEYEDDSKVVYFKLENLLNKTIDERCRERRITFFKETNSFNKLDYDNDPLLLSQDETVCLLYLSYLNEIDGI